MAEFVPTPENDIPIVYSDYDYYYQWSDAEKTVLKRSAASIGKTTDVGNSRVLFVPVDEANADYQEYLVWKEIDGNVAADYEEPELTWDNIRAQRNELLQETDWTVIPDTSVDQAAWKTYRQALRDIPETFKDKKASEVVWHTKPSTAKAS
tara:strand:+ start:10 stop:462 length:453 start_codon:yes stop_codon:yes gene_type:complete